MVKLRRQRFVMGDHQGWLLDFLDNVGHGKGFTRTGDAQESPGGVLFAEAFA